MQQLFAILPDLDIDLIGEIIEESMPWLLAWIMVAGLALGAVAARVAIGWVAKAPRSSNDLRSRRFG